MAAERTTDSNDNGKVRLSMWLTKRHHSGLKQLAADDGRTVSDIIRQLVGSHLRAKQVKKKDVGGEES